MSKKCHYLTAMKWNIIAIYGEKLKAVVLKCVANYQSILIRCGMCKDLPKVHLLTGSDIDRFRQKKVLFLCIHIYCEINQGQMSSVKWTLIFGDML